MILWQIDSVLKRLPARFYRSDSGREPVREWLKNLDIEDRKLIGEDIKDVEFSWPIGMPLVRGLGSGAVGNAQQFAARPYRPRPVLRSRRTDGVAEWLLSKRRRRHQNRKIDLAIKRQKGEGS